MSTETPSSSSHAVAIARHLAIAPGDSGLRLQAVQLDHRLALIETWDGLGAKLQGARVMDIGCGQGDQTAALLGWRWDQQGKHEGGVKEVLGVDPGPRDYGAPFTLEQAQAKLLEAPFAQAESSNRLRFASSDAPAAFVAHLDDKQQPSLDVAILSHSAWYFPSSSALLATFEAAKRAGVKQLCLAEWNLDTPFPSDDAKRAAAWPHVLAVLTHAQARSLTSGRTSGSSSASAARKELAAMAEEGNVRLPLSPRAFTQLAAQAGWTLRAERSFTPSALLQDGSWEAGGALAYAGLLAKIKAEEGADMDGAWQRAALALQAHLAVLEAAVKQAGGVKNVKAMDVWTAVFEPAQAQA